jgi:hypothetical protein
MEFPLTLPKNVVTGFLMQILLRSMEVSKKSSAGDGNPALILDETNGSFADVVSETEWILIALD